MIAFDFHFIHGSSQYLKAIRFRKIASGVFHKFQVDFFHHLADLEAYNILITACSWQQVSEHRSQTGLRSSDYSLIAVVHGITFQAKVYYIILLETFFSTRKYSPLPLVMFSLTCCVTSATEIKVIDG